MKRDELERHILDLWLKTQISLTRVHIQYHAKAPRKKLGTWLDELVVDGVLSVDVNDDGDLIYEVPGASRPPGGAKTFAELEKLESLGADSTNSLGNVGGDLVLSKGTSLARKASRSLLKKPAEGEKSILLSSALSFFFGPLGWFYAGSYKEAALGSAAYIALGAILPSFLLTPLLAVAMPVSAIAGLVYSWRYNRSGARRPLMLGDGSDDDDE